MGFDSVGLGDGVRARRMSRAFGFSAIAWSLVFFFASPARAQVNGPRFEISFPAAAHAEAITGRVFVMITRDAGREPRLQVGNWADSAPFFGADVDQLKPGDAAVIDAGTLGYPLRSLKDLPSGDYYVQGLMQIYTDFHRADGRVLWMHMDQWEGQHFTRSPGNLISEVQRIHLDAVAGYSVKLSLAKVIPPIVVPADTAWVKHVKIQSKLMSEFWGGRFILGRRFCCQRVMTSIRTFLIRWSTRRDTLVWRRLLGFRPRLARRVIFSGLLGKIAGLRLGMSFIRLGTRRIFLG